MVDVRFPARVDSLRGPQSNKCVNGVGSLRAPSRGRTWLTTPEEEAVEEAVEEEGSISIKYWHTSIPDSLSLTLIIPALRWGWTGFTTAQLIS